MDPRFADQRGARAALTLSFLAALALYLLLAAASSPALPGVYLLFASRLPGALMHTLPGRAWGVGARWGQVGAACGGPRTPPGRSACVRGLALRAGQGWGRRGARLVEGQVSGGKGLGRWVGEGPTEGLSLLSSPAPSPAAQMVITDLSAPEERPAALGRLGLCFGVGVILGSLLGGTLVSAYG